MTILNVPLTSKHKILALGPESAGNFSFYSKKQVQLSPDFGDLLEEKNWQKYQRAVNNFLYKNKMKPSLIITDLHPVYKTTIYGQELAKKYQAKFFQIQHHHAHICSTLGEYLSEGHELPTNLVGIACDGTGYGLDGSIWGGEVFQMSNVPARTTDWELDVRSGGQCPMLNKSQIPNPKSQINPKFQSVHTKPTSYKLSPLETGSRHTTITHQKVKVRQPTSYQIERIGSLEPQTLIGGDLAVQEPARVLLAILHKAGLPKAKIWQYLKKHYNKNQFELLYNQLLQNFNCQPTTSTARILDAASLLLGFCKNTRNYKHEPAILLEKNSSIHYDLRPMNYDLNNRYEISTTKLFQYLIKNLHRNKNRLAATVQYYLAQGLYEIVRGQRSDKSQILNPKSPARTTDWELDVRSGGQTNSKHQIPRPNDRLGIGCSVGRANKSKIQNPKYELRTTNYELFFSGGLAANQIIKNFMTKKGVITNKKIPSGDASLSFGQIIYCLLKL